MRGLHGRIGCIRVRQHTQARRAEPRAQGREILVEAQHIRIDATAYPAGELTTIGADRARAEQGVIEAAEM